MIVMRTLGLAGLLLAAFVYAQSEPAATPVPLEEDAPATVVELADVSLPGEPGDVARGQQLSATCVACHGIDGNSLDPQYPKLAGQNERYIARQLALYASGEREDPIMMAFAAPLGPQDMRDLGAYFATQTGSPGIADETPIASGPNEGRAFYEVGQSLYRGGDASRDLPACAACHSPTGAGNPGPPYPKLRGQHAAYTAEMLRRYRDGKRLDGEHGDVMAAIARDLSDEEIDSLASYIEGLYATRAVAGP